MIVWREYGSRFVLMRTINSDRLVYFKDIPKGGKANILYVDLFFSSGEMFFCSH